MIDAGLVDSSPLTSSRQHNNANNMNGQNSSSNVTINRHSRGFGKDVSSDVTFNDEQKGQLSKLREEAVKAGNK